MTTGWVLEIYKAFLGLYPGSYRLEFGEEMVEVFTQAVEEAGASGASALRGLLLKELRDLPGMALREHFRQRLRQNESLPLDGARWDGPPTQKETLLVLAAFLLPAALILFGAAVETPLFVLLPAILAVMVAAFLLGLYKGLPRWSLPYLGIGLSILGSLYLFNWLADLLSPSVVYWFGPGPWDESTYLLLQALWAGVLWLGLFFLTFLVLAVLTVLRRFCSLILNIRRDWTLVSFIIYGEAVFALILLFDEYSHKEPFVISSLLLLCAGAYFYLHGPSAWQRMLALLSGLSVAMWVAAYGKWSILPIQHLEVWVERSPEAERWFAAGSTILAWGWMIAALLAPALLRLLPRREGERTT